MPHGHAEGGSGEASDSRDTVDPSRTYARSLDMLARAPRSVRDLRRRLLLKGEMEAHVDAAIERLTAAGLLDDAAYARAFVRSKVASQGFSRRRLQQELAKRGVARDVADAAIVEVLHDDEIDEAANVERAALKKLRTLAGVDEETQRRRLYAYLARRGYSVDQVRVVLERLRRMSER
ncbi:MAG TPA: regulatory protein RecX [Gemmatimonadaceae bacterium]|nr:regulatory protein RecX [Gemmatimonadaceae bacterium]